jgi:hypothetical protein
MALAGNAGGRLHLRARPIALSLFETFEPKARRFLKRATVRSAFLSLGLVMTTDIYMLVAIGLIAAYAGLLFLLPLNKRWKRPSKHELAQKDNELQNLRQQVQKLQNKLNNQPRPDKGQSHGNQPRHNGQQHDVHAVK